MEDITVKNLRMLPETLGWLLRKKELDREYILYQQEWVEGLYGEPKELMVRCTCTACGQSWYTEKVKNECCRAAYSPAPYGFRDFETEEAIIDGMELSCHMCGAEARAEFTGRVPLTAEIPMGRRYVAEVRNLEGELALAEWSVGKVAYKNGVTRYVKKLAELYVLKEKTIERWNGVWHGFSSWAICKVERRKNYLDSMGGCQVAPWEPEILEGTLGENSKLDLYTDLQEKGLTIYPVTYLRLWQKHKGIEKLMTCGAGPLLGRILAHNWRNKSGYCGNAIRGVPEMDGILWKKNRPGEMLGLNREELRQCVKEDWDREVWLSYKLLRDSGDDVGHYTALLKGVSLYDIEKIRELGWPVRKTLQYLKEQNKGLNYLKDYRDMARKAGWRLENQRLLWPKDLVKAHDEANKMIKWKEDEVKSAKIRAAYEKYKGLEWAEGDWCLLLPRSQGDLIREGNVLHHCVGGYAGTHCAGHIILFLRHRRRPERSWYTLNVNMTDPECRIIQLHGYRNDVKRKVPQELWDWVNRWQAEVARPWATKNLKKKKEKTA